MRSTVPAQSDPVISFELTEVTQGEWQLRIVGPSEALGELGDKTIVARVRITPNLVPGVPFTATVIRAAANPAPD
jgi:hypothetical protein